MTDAAPDPHPDGREEEAGSGPDGAATTPSASNALFGLGALMILGALALAAVALFVL